MRWLDRFDRLYLRVLGALLVLIAGVGVYMLAKGRW